MNRKNLALSALTLALATSTPASGLFGLGGPDLQKAETPVEVSEIPDAHWLFQPDSDGDHAVVEHYSPNLDGLGFDNQSRCYGHSLLSTRWFQYIVKPLKNGTISSISPEEFRDFWGGEMDYPVSYDITPANVDNERLQPYSMYNEKARVAIGKLVGYYHDFQNNLFDHGDDMYDDAGEFREDLAERIEETGLPPQLAMFRNGGGHAVNAYKVEEGTAMYGNTDGSTGSRVKAYKVSLYDPNDPGSGDAADDAAYEQRRYFIVIENGGGFVSFSERMEWGYDRYLRQGSNNPDGTWHIPDGKYGISENTADDSGEIRSWWHWNDISDEEAREIAGVD